MAIFILNQSLFKRFTVRELPKRSQLVMLKKEDSNLDYLVIYIPNQSSVKYRTIDLSQLVEQN